MKPKQLRAGRNDPCPCGSGRKFKHCCIGEAPNPPAKRSARFAKAAGIAAGAVILAVVLVMPGRLRDTSGAGGVAPSAGSSRSREALPGSAMPARSATPAPWEYDAANNRHWHPGHGHWHDGPPPSRAGLPQVSATAREVLPGSATPAPWEYDAASNRHWHPDHGHWHDGPPPDGQTEIK